MSIYFTVKVGRLRDSSHLKKEYVMMGEVKKGNGGVVIESKGRCRYMRGVGWMVGGRGRAP